MNELKSVILHHLERLSKRAGASFDPDVRAELSEAFDAAERRIAELERDKQYLLGRVDGIQKRVDNLEQRVNILQSHIH